MYSNSDDRDWCLEQVGNGHWTWLVMLHYLHQNQFHRTEWADQWAKSCAVDEHAVVIDRPPLSALLSGGK